VVLGRGRGRTGRGGGEGGEGAEVHCKEGGLGGHCTEGEVQGQGTVTTWWQIMYRQWGVVQ
jgi:hypothetical protein